MRKLLFISLLPLIAFAADKVYRAGEDGVTAPRVKQQVGPKYTEEARTAHVQGTVLVAFEITPEGRAENIRVVKGLDAGLDRNAVDAIRQWTFEPGTKEGKPVRVSAQAEINFRLDYAFLPAGDRLPPPDLRRA